MNTLGSILQLIASPDNDTAGYRTRDGGRGSFSAAPTASHGRDSFPFMAASTGLGNVDSGGEGNGVGPGAPQPALLQLPKCTVTLGRSVWGTRFRGFPRRGHNWRGVLGGSEQLHVLPPSNCLLTQLRPGERLPESPPSSCKHLPRAGFAEATQHPLHPSLHPGTCRPAPTRGLLLLPAGLSPLPAGVSSLISPTRRPQWGPPAPTCSGGPQGALPAARCREKVRSSTSSRIILAASMVAV